MKRGTIGTAVLCLAVFLAVAAPVSSEEVTFTFEPPDMWGVTSASVRGSFNDWGETPMIEQDDGAWTITLELAPGEFNQWSKHAWIMNKTGGMDAGGNIRAHTCSQFEVTLTHID